MAVPVGPGLQPTAGAGIGQLEVSVSFLLLVGETHTGKGSARGYILPERVFFEFLVALGLFPRCLQAGKASLRYRQDQREGLVARVKFFIRSPKRPPEYGEDVVR